MASKTETTKCKLAHHLLSQTINYVIRLAPLETDQLRIGYSTPKSPTGK
jgi:hypothetical protein